MLLKSWLSRARPGAPLELHLGGAARNAFGDAFERESEMPRCGPSNQHQKHPRWSSLNSEPHTLNPQPLNHAARKKRNPQRSLEPQP